jgi:two-component system phosphate regulon response regulator OmpR
MLTARGEVTDRIAGLESGADDYLPKPFEPRELVARIQSVLRRTDVGEGSPILTFGLLTVNTEIQEVTIGGELIDLTSTEYELLTLFIKNPGKVLNRDQIMEWVSGIEWELFNRSVDVLVSRLRGKLRDDPKHPIYLKTIWGTGYLFLGRRS